MMRLLALTVTVGVLVTPWLRMPVARAQDPIAPPGAPAMWLPPYDWVMNHHFPYDVATLHAALRTDDAELRAFFGGQSHRVVPPLIDLARRRGVARWQLLRILMRPWREEVASRHLLALRRRASLTLSQGHLTQHMLFHPLHEKALMDAEPMILGAKHPRVAALRRAGMSNLEIGEHFGRTEKEITTAVRRVLRRAMNQAVRDAWTPREQGRRYLRIQIDAIPAWLTFARNGAGAEPEPAPIHDAMGEAARAAAGAAAALSSRAGRGPAC